MPDPLCRECAMLTGGCWRHNGSGVYVVDHDGMRMIMQPARTPIPGGWLYHFAPIGKIGVVWPEPTSTGVWRLLA